MLTKPEKTFSYIFFLVVIAELICGSVERFSLLHYVTKPAIVISLLIFFFKESESLSQSIRNLTMLALGFSLLGDILLLFVHRSPSFFILGLLAFLFAHVMYIWVFLKQRNHNKKPFLFLTALLIYAIGLFTLLKNGLGEMVLPVLIYMLAILGMATTAFLREGKVPKISYKLVLLGAIFFLVSDSLLAINKFYTVFEFAHVLIMSTYALAQYFMVMGIKKHL